MAAGKDRTKDHMNEARGRETQRESEREREGKQNTAKEEMIQRIHEIKAVMRNGGDDICTE